MGARMALRREGDDLLDDVFVRDVSLFRAEVLDRDRLWLCCYLDDTGVEGDRVTFQVVAEGNRLSFEVIEAPAGRVQMED